MKGWRWITAALVMPLIAVTVMAAGPRQTTYRAGTQIIDNVTFFDKNSLLMFVTNTGSIAYDKTSFLGKADGLYFPRGTNKTVIFAGGIWMGAKVDGNTRVFVSEYSNECVPGPMKNGSFQADQGRFRVYKINKGDTPESNPDYANWPYDDGAPSALDDNGQRIPLLQGDQALWAVYNDADPSAHTNNSGSTTPLGVEVHQYVFGYARSGALGQTIFVRYQIINKGGNMLEDTYISVWADPDLGDAGDDFVGCDTALSLGYCYNDGDDATYGSRPPAVGYDFFQGPIVPSPDDSAWVSSKGVFIHGYKNLPMTSFNKYINGTDPQSSIQTYNYMQGLSPEGDPQADPNTDEVTKFVVAGDPVAGTGWLDDASDDRRYMMSAGPFTMAPGDTQEVVIAVLVGQGADRLSSITELKRADAIAQSVFDLNFEIPGPPPQPSIWAIPHDGAVQLFWGQEANGDVQYGLGPINEETGEPDTLQTFLMEGLNIYQGPSSSGPWTKIASYDVNNSIERIYSDVDQDDGVERRVVQRGTNSGLEQGLWVTNDRIAGGRLINNHPYFFTVTAYNYDDQNKREFNIGESEDSYGIVTEAFENLVGAAVVEAVPRSMAGVLADTAEHIAGPSDGSVLIDFFDQNLVSSDTYRVTFDTLDAWFLTNTRTAEILLSDQTTSMGTEAVDGMVIRVLGPPPGVKDWDIPSGTRRFTWGGGAGGFEFEGFHGAIGWASPNNVFGGGPPGVPAPLIKNVVLKLADVDVDGNYSADDPNVSYGYRYGRGFSGEPARPEFEPFIVNKASGGYHFQDFTKSVPLSAWDMESDPPRRLVVGHLENNVEGGAVDGKWWPPFYGDASNVAGSGPREWLFIFDADYSETEDPALAVESISNALPIMYWLTVARRQEVAWETGDEFLILANHVNSDADIFEFTTQLPGSVDGTVIAESVENVHPVPNPYYNVSELELDQFRRQLKFINLPAAETTIRIFNLAGDLVITLVKDDPAMAEITWNLLTANSLPVASGLYIYHVDAKGIGTKVGKLAVFTEVEQVEQF